MPSLQTEATFKMNVAQLMKWQQAHPEAAAALFAASVANQPELQQAQGMRSGWDRVKHEIKMTFNWEGYRQRLEASIFTNQLARTFPSKEIEGPKSQAVAQLQTPVATAQELAYGRNSPELTRRVERRVELSQQAKAEIEQAARWQQSIVEWVRNPEHEAAFTPLDKALSGALAAQGPNLSDVNRQQTMKEMRNNLREASKILNKPLELGGNVGAKVKQEFAKKWPDKKLSQQVGVGI